MATFMAKWSPDWPGQSGHIHLSLKGDDGRSSFHDEAAPHRMSDTMRHFVGGQQKLLPSLLAMIASTVNSYSRLIPGFWAPTSATWAVENRTTALRVIPGSPSAQRVEVRIAAADANPYIALAASLGAGLWGIENRIEPDAPVQGNAYALPEKPELALPRTLWEAAQALRRPPKPARCSATPSWTTSPPLASGKNASSAATSPTGNSPDISRSSRTRHADDSYRHPC
jgi:glutamine synthetase